MKRGFSSIQKKPTFNLEVCEMNNIRNYTDSSSGLTTPTAMGFYDGFLERLCVKNG
jgi:hypothetical protein